MKSKVQICNNLIPEIAVSHPAKRIDSVSFVVHRVGSGHWNKPLTRSDDPYCVCVCVCVWFFFLYSGWKPQR